MAGKNVRYPSLPDNRYLRQDEGLQTWNQKARQLNDKSAEPPNDFIHVNKLRGESRCQRTLNTKQARFHLTSSLSSCWTLHLTHI